MICAESRGFTMLELLVVISIIFVLLGLITVGYGMLNKKRRALEAAATTEALATALIQMKADYQYEDIFGKSDGGKRAEDLCDTGAFVRELLPAHSEWAGEFQPRINSKKTPYLQLRQQSFKAGQLADPWGHPYKYFVFVKEANQWPYEIECVYSHGPDGVPFTEDDIVCNVAEYPVPADKKDSAKPARDLKTMQQNLGWPERPKAWK